jgi:SpoVK/Ycf46/Vps4 family AAA+-type ATPase
LFSVVASSHVFRWFQVSLASDASLEDVASLTEGFTGADLAAILTDAGLAAVHELLDSQETGVPEREPCISKELLMSVARKARPSTPADEKRRHDREFGEFVLSRKSISTKVHTQFHVIKPLITRGNNNNTSILLMSLVTWDSLDNYFESFGAGKRVERQKSHTSLSQLQHIHAWLHDHH